MSLLEVDALAAGYDDAVVLRGVSLTVHANEIVAVIGPNGAGKSTMLKAVYNLVRRYGGSVRFAGNDVTGVRPDRLTRLGLNFVPQTDNVFNRMTVEENLILAGFLLAGAARRRQIEALYGFFPDLARQRRLPARRLSGGQRQMLAIARALMISPRVLMLDEPSAGLSPRLVESVFAKLVEIRDSDVAILLVEQNARAALAIGDRAYVMVEGRERHEAPASALRDDPQLARLYLGGAR